jgi:hypothetical protein
LQGGVGEEGDGVAAPDEELCFFVGIRLGDVDAVDGLRVKDLELAEEAGVLDVVDLEPGVFACEKEDTIGSDVVEGEGGYGAEGVDVLQPRDGLALGGVSECPSLSE